MPKLGRRSERTELDYQMAPEIVRKDAPFGTNDTPVITMKIIGGRQVPVIEKHPTYNDYGGSRIQPLRPIADKPNHLDPRIHGDNPGGYYNRDVQNICVCRYECRCGKRVLQDDDPTHLANKRPDSKDVVRSQFKTLPPIQQNRTRNDLSTVFEAEPWTDNRNPPLASETEYKQNYHPGRDMDQGMDSQQYYQQSGSKDHHYVSESEKNRLYMLVPRNVLLPVDPIKLTRDQERTLCKLICNELPRFNPKELRDVYVECSQHDRELRGFCGIETLDNNLRKHKAFLSDPLRIIAAQYVDPNYPGKVNYEKVLSFIGSALQLNERGDLSNERPRYYMQNGESFQTGSIYRDREVAKLLRMVEQELSKNTYSMDWTRWQNAFYERDRDHRDTLSAAQIKDICYDQKLPLSDSLINQILQLCEDNNRDGQYRWHAFLEFLSRVRPHNTGLPMPRRGTSPRRDISPRRGENRPEDRDIYSPDRNRSRNQSPARQYDSRSPVPDAKGSVSPQGRYRPPSPDERKRLQRNQYPIVEDKYYASYAKHEQPADRFSYDDQRRYEAPRQRYGERFDDRPRQDGYYDRRYDGSGPDLRYGDPGDDRRRSYAEAPRYGDRDRDSYRRYESEPYRDGYRGGRGDETYRSGRGEESPRLTKEQRIMQLSNQLRELETKYEITREGLASNERPWLDRFLKMAQALYNSDIANKGSLPRKDVLDIVNQYNNAFNLNLDMTRANMLAISPDNIDKSGNIILKNFLASLSAERISYKV